MTAQKAKIKSVKRPKIKIARKSKLAKKKSVKTVKKFLSRKKTLQRKKPRNKPTARRIKKIGVGGGGGSIVSEIGRSLEKATFVIADTDVRALKKKTGIKYFCFGQNLTHGLGTGVNTRLAKQAAEQED